MFYFCKKTSKAFLMKNLTVYKPFSKIGGLIYIEEAPKNNRGSRKAKFQCPVCKGYIIRLITEVKSSNQQACKNCSLKEGKNNPNYKHGFSYKHKSSEYQVYYGMRARCYNPNHVSYENYGGRGIRICDRWLGKKGFENFVADVGQRPSMLYSIDRLNVNGNYEPCNCKWSTSEEQAINRRNGLNSSLELLKISLNNYPSDIVNIKDYLTWIGNQIDKFKLINYGI